MTKTTLKLSLAVATLSLAALCGLSLTASADDAMSTKAPVHNMVPPVNTTETGGAMTAPAMGTTANDKAMVDQEAAAVKAPVHNMSPKTP